jgi:hypothetical protein
VLSFKRKFERNRQCGRTRENKHRGQFPKKPASLIGCNSGNPKEVNIAGGTKEALLFCCARTINVSMGTMRCCCCCCCWRGALYIIQSAHNILFAWPAFFFSLLAPGQWGATKDLIMPLPFSQACESAQGLQARINKCCFLTSSSSKRTTHTGIYEM